MNDINLQDWMATSDTSSEYRPAVGDQGYFSNKPVLGSPYEWDMSTIREIGRNQFHTGSNESFLYFIPADKFDPMENWKEARENMFQVAFGSNIYKRRKLVVLQDQQQPSAPVAEVIRNGVPRRPEALRGLPADVEVKTYEPNKPARAQEPLPQLEVGKEYFFTNAPSRGFVRGTLLQAQDNYPFVAEVIKNGEVVRCTFTFCITEQHLRAKRTDMLLSAMRPTNGTPQQRPAMRPPLQRPMPRMSMPQPPMGGMMSQRGLVDGDRVWFTTTTQPRTADMGRGIFRGTEGNNFLVEDVTHDIIRVPLLIPADIYEREMHTPDWRRMLLAVRSNEIYAPRFAPAHR